MTIRIKDSRVFQKTVDFNEETQEPVYEDWPDDRPRWRYSAWIEKAEKVATMETAPFTDEERQMRFDELMSAVKAAVFEKPTPTLEPA